MNPLDEPEDTNRRYYETPRTHGTNLKEFTAPSKLRMTEQISQRALEESKSDLNLGPLSLSSELCLLKERTLHSIPCGNESTVSFSPLQLL